MLFRFKTGLSVIVLKDLPGVPKGSRGRIEVLSRQATVSFPSTNENKLPKILHLGLEELASCCEFEIADSG